VDQICVTQNRDERCQFDDVVTTVFQKICQMCHCQYARSSLVRWSDVNSIIPQIKIHTQF